MERETPFTLEGFEDFDGEAHDLFRLRSVNAFLVKVSYSLNR
jgi:hypothetical protein